MTLYGIMDAGIRYTSMPNAGTSAPTDFRRYVAKLSGINVTEDMGGGMKALKANIEGTASPLIPAIPPLQFLAAISGWVCKPIRASCAWAVRYNVLFDAFRRHAGFVQVRLRRNP